MVFPEAVDAEGHEVVHGVVGGGDGAEDGTDCWIALLVVGLSYDSYAVVDEDISLPFDSFNDSAMLSKPKCVVFSLLRLGFCSARYGEEEKARTGRGVTVRVESRNRFAARGTNDDMIDVLVVAEIKVPQADHPGTLSKPNAHVAPSSISMIGD